ncbi:protein TonB [Nitrosomonas sp. Nm51]|uniref:energy transducer TonB n=1 Tax=Nitrosomonas sp. Nm51 TaxID=133720 RepID=UPI0008ACF53A|nr:energy transducer TonB [Nitrosomonas sp. Nm51]SER58920.1 protein TonB [Nitrosomonas sp. Nm51]
MSSLQNWGIPIFTSLLFHTVIMLLPVQHGNQRENKDVREMTFRLVSLPQKTQAPSVEKAVYQPKRKPSPPEITHTRPKPQKSVPAKTAGIPIQKKTEAASDEPDPAPQPPATDLAAVTQSLSGNSSPGNMPADPVVLSTELSVICPEFKAPSYPRASRQLGEYGDVVLRLEVSKAGVVKSVQVVNSSGYQRLDKAAIEATRTWRCNPPHRNGRPVSTIALQPFSFVLQ